MSHKSTTTELTQCGAGFVRGGCNKIRGGGGEELVGAEALTIDESIEDELAVLFHQVVDVSENATVQRKEPLANNVFQANWPPSSPSRLFQLGVLAAQEAFQSVAQEVVDGGADETRRGR